MSYHDIYITTRHFERTSIFNLPYNIEIRCHRTTGWQVWERWAGVDRLLGGEYDDKEWLVLDVVDVDRHVIIDSRDKPDEQ